MEKDSELFVGLDTSKLKISVEVADGEPSGEGRFFWRHFIRALIGIVDGSEAGDAKSDFPLLIRGWSDRI